MNKLYLLSFGFFLGLVPYSKSQTTDVYFIGHSACGVVMPNMIDDIAGSLGDDYDFGLQMIPGACLSSSWDNHATSDTAYSTDSWVELATGDYEAVIMLELLPLEEVVYTSWGCPYTSVSVGGMFKDLAVSGNPSAQTYLVQLWQEYDFFNPNKYQDWKAAMINERPLYNQVVDSINLLHGGSDMCLIPVADALIALCDSIEAGAVPGLTDWEDIFLFGFDPWSNIVHMNDTGNYFNALVYYTTVFGHDPSGATGQCYDPDNWPYAPVAANTAAKMQEIAWDIVSTHPYACATYTGIEETNQPTVGLYPNPTSGQLNITIDNLGNGSELRIYNATGQLVISDRLNNILTEVDMQAFPAGLYHVQVIREGDRPISQKVILE